MKNWAIFEGLLGVKVLLPPFSFSAGEKDGQGIGGELLKMLLENRRGMAKITNLITTRRGTELLAPAEDQAEYFSRGVVAVWSSCEELGKDGVRGYLEASEQLAIVFVLSCGFDLVRASRDRRRPRLQVDADM